MTTTADLQAYAAQQAEAYNINPVIFQAQIGQESSWNTSAQNGNASGIAQFMPATAAQYGVNTSDPYSSIAGAAAYDSSLLQANGGDYTSMLNSYGTTANNPTVFQKFQDLISGQGLNGSSGSTTGSATSTSCGLSNISCMVSKYGTALIAIILGIAVLTIGVWGADK